jgi:2-polyprenyl-3-methyl-5-hydroxy-6-metoxy-1,4-benzoquinol methylase
VFDAGCGTGYLVRELLKGGKDAYGVEAASLPLETYAADLLANNTVRANSTHKTLSRDADSARA